jgi:hypothetical protein
MTRRTLPLLLALTSLHSPISLFSPTIMDTLSDAVEMHLQQSTTRTTRTAQYLKACRTSLSELQRHFDKPAKHAAEALGLCATAFKRICRRRGIKRWPHRRYRSLQSTLRALEKLIPVSEPQETIKLQMEMDCLRIKIQSLGTSEVSERSDDGVKQSWNTPLVVTPSVSPSVDFQFEGMSVCTTPWRKELKVPQLSYHRQKMHTPLPPIKSVCFMSMQLKFERPERLGNCISRILC